MLRLEARIHPLRILQAAIKKELFQRLDMAEFERNLIRERFELQILRLLGFSELPANGFLVQAGIVDRRIDHVPPGRDASATRAYNRRARLQTEKTAKEQDKHPAHILSGNVPSGYRQ